MRVSSTGGHTAGRYLDSGPFERRQTQSPQLVRDACTDIPKLQSVHTTQTHRDTACSITHSFSSDLHENLVYFKIPSADIESIRSKLAFKIFDEYANILKGMYSTKFNGCPEDDRPKDSDVYTSIYIYQYLYLTDPEVTNRSPPNPHLRT